MILHATATFYTPQSTDYNSREMRDCHEAGKKHRLCSGKFGELFSNKICFLYITVTEIDKLPHKVFPEEWLTNI